MNREKMLHEIMALDFALTDLKLYLNSHPDDVESIALFNNIVKKRRVMIESYQCMYGPLIAEDYDCSKDAWDWVDEPWPWDKTAQNCCM